MPKNLRTIIIALAYEMAKAPAAVLPLQEQDAMCQEAKQHIDTAYFMF